MSLVVSIAFAVVVPLRYLQAGGELGALRTFGVAAAIGVSVIALGLFVILRWRAAAPAVPSTSYGQYELVRRLGVGGMGEVWEARHQSLLRPAAIKLILGEAAAQYGKGARARFRREALATGALSSPHTVALYDFGEADDGTLYYAMERLEGIDLESLVSRFGAIPAERVIGIAIQACDSLLEAHERGFVHRDIKPANLLLCRVGGEVDFVKVLDFGLVKPRFLAEDGPVSVQGAVSGTPGFVAPEHASGQPLDGRADLYALGCVLYFLLTGQRVFHRRTRLEILSAHLTVDPVPPGQRAPFAHIPAEVDALVMKLLTRERDGRPASARVLRDELRALEQTLGERWTSERAHAWWSEHLPELMQPRDLLPV